MGNFFVLLSSRQHGTDFNFLSCRKAVSMRERKFLLVGVGKRDGWMTSFFFLRILFLPFSLLVPFAHSPHRKSTRKNTTPRTHQYSRNRTPSGLRWVSNIAQRLQAYVECLASVGNKAKLCNPAWCFVFISIHNKKNADGNWIYDHHRVMVCDIASASGSTAHREPTVACFVVLLKDLLHTSNFSTEVWWLMGIRRNLLDMHKIH